MRLRGDGHSKDVNLAREPAYAPNGAPASAGKRWEAFTWRGELSTLPRRLPLLAWAIPLAIAAAYLAVFAVQLPKIVTELYWDSDFASGFTIPETLVKSGLDGHMVMASSGQWVSLWFGLLTGKLPLHRQLWELAPPAVFLAAVLAVGWAVWQVADRRAAVLAVLIGCVASPLALVFFLAGETHNSAYLCTALIGAYLVWLARGEGRARVIAWGVPALVGVAAGVCLASDFLLAATGLIPLALTAILAGLRRERRSRLIALSALGTVAVAIPIARLTSSTMNSLGYLTLRTPTSVAPLGELPARAKLLFKGLKSLFNGYLGPEKPGTLHAELGIASDIVMCAALAALIVVGTRTLVRFIASAVRNGSTQTPAQQARSLHVIYWVSSALAACGAFWIVAETGGGTNAHEAYYGTVIFSVAAVVPLLLSARSAARWLMPAGATIYFAASLVGLTSGYTNISAEIARFAPRVTRIAQANDVTAGYGGWEEASSFTWNTHARVTVRPLMECSNPEGAGVCPFYMASVPSWYTPRRRHTFLLIDSEEPWVSSLPSGLGKPLAIYSLGAMRMYIYPYDIASRLGPSQD
jgi:hypothetical protein